MDLILYDEAPSFDLDPVQRKLSGFGVELDVRDSLPAPQRDQGRPEEWVNWMAWHLAWSKVRNPQRPIPEGIDPKPLEIDREAAALRGQAKFPGPLYDGKRLLEAYHGPLPKAERPPTAGPIVVLTDRLIGTFEGTRYHVRFLVTGHPIIVSPPGLIDGPARDREYYLAKQMVGRDAEEITDDDHLTRGDERLPTALTSALLQALAYHETGQAFCQDETCRFFNPHWQADLLGSMATEAICNDHEAFLSALSTV